MKKILTVLLLLSFALIMSCDPAPDNNNGNNNPKDTPQQNRTGTVVLDKGLGSITVQVMGMTTQAEWNDIANKIATQINNQVEGDVTEYGEQATVDSWKPFFDRGIVFVVESNPVGYSGFKTIGDGKTIYIELDKITTTTFVSAGMNKAANNETYPTVYTPLYTNPATITQATPNGLAFAGSVTIKSDDTYTPAAWDAVVANVITALNRGYKKFETVGGLDDALIRIDFESAFHASQNAEIIVLASASKKIAVLSTDYTKMYLQASAINNTLDLCSAVEVMAAKGGSYELP